MGRLVSAAEVAAGIAYLASPLAGAVTGTSLAIDGGMSGLRLRPPGPRPSRLTHRDAAPRGVVNRHRSDD